MASLRPPPPSPLEEGLAAVASAAPIPRAGVFIPASSQPMMGGPAPLVEHARLPIQAGRLRRSLAASTSEGFFAEIVTACAGGAVMTGWGLHLGCSPFVLGVLSGLPFFGQIAHLPAAWIVGAFGRRRVCITAVGLARQVLVLLALLPFLPLHQHGKQALLLGTATLSAVLGMIGNNAWQSWMGDLVPVVIRGRYFGRRAAICTSGGMLASFASGLVLDRAYGGHDVVATERLLALLALVACVAGAVSTVLMSRQHDPDRRQRPREVSLGAALAPFLDPTARNFLVYQVTFNAGVGLLGPFVAVHMLDNLHMGFTRVAMYGTWIALARVIAAPFWGQAIDRVGPRKVLLTASTGIVLLPCLLLLPTTDFLWPVLLEATVAGACWSGHGLAVLALPLSIAPPARRPFYLGAFTAAGGLSFGSASALGGVIVASLPAHFDVLGRAFLAVHALFALSCAVRAAAVFASSRLLLRSAASRSSSAAS